MSKDLLSPQELADGILMVARTAESIERAEFKSEKASAPVRGLYMTAENIAGDLVNSGYLGTPVHSVLSQTVRKAAYSLVRDRPRAATAQQHVRLIATVARIARIGAEEQQ